MRYLMNVSDAVALLGLLLILVICRFIYNGITNPLNKVPGPWYARWTTLRLKLATLSGRRIHYVHALHQQYGPYVRLSPTEIAVNDAEGFKQVHSFTKPWNKSRWYEVMVQQKKPVFFSMAEPEPHGARRKMFARSFSKSYIRDHWEAEVARKVNFAIDRFHDEAEREGVANVLKWLTFMASDVSAHLMFGESFHTLETGVKSHFIEVLEKVLMGNVIGSELPILRVIGKRLPIKAVQDVFNPYGLIWQYAQEAVKTMRARVERRNIFAEIMAQVEKKEQLDDDDVTCEALGLIIAGTDTTAITMTYFIYAVLSQPQIQQALEEEAATLPEDYSDADIEKLPLISAAIQETLRMYGATPGMLPRMVPAEGAYMSGYYIPGGTTAITQSYSLHRDANAFPDPERFIIERWLAGTTSKYRVTDAARAVYSPFGSGSRTCIGIHMAYMELRHGAAAFLRKCPGATLAPSATAECMEQQNYFLIMPAGHKCEIVL